MDHFHLRLYAPQGTEHDEPRADTQPPRPNTHPQNTSGNKPSVSYSRVVGEARVAVSVGDLLPILAEAWQDKRAWLGDFSSDRVIVSQDLYEVLLAYKRLNKVA